MPGRTAEGPVENVYARRRRKTSRRAGEPAWDGGCPVSVVGADSMERGREPSGGLRGERTVMAKGVKIGVLLWVFWAMWIAGVSAQGRAERGDEETEGAAQSTGSRFSVGVKGFYHTFWKQGLLDNGGGEYGRPGLDTGSVDGLGGEVDLDYTWKPWAVFTFTAGAYQGGEGAHKIDVVTGYGLLTAKLQRVGEMADYYVGAGFGGYFSRMKADGTAYALKPGVHVLLGIRIHVDPRWSILIEDRAAFTSHANGGFGGLDLGGNFVLVGCSYHL